MVVCTFAGCKKVYNDARFLPCGNRTCAAHIEAMMLKSNNIKSGDRKMIKCHFCEKIHTFPDDADEFPVDRIIPMLLNIKHGTEHDAAKKSFNDVTNLLEQLAKFDKEDYVTGYFERLEADIVLEREANVQKLVAHYQKLVDDVHERKVKCLRSLRTNQQLECELEAIRRTFLEHESKLKRTNWDFLFKTLDGDQTRWKEIQLECDTLLASAKSLGEELKGKLIGEQMTSFVASASDTEIESMCGHLGGSTFNSTIFGNYKMETDLIQLCMLSGKKFQLLYRASRDGFGAANFHAKCDNQSKTLSIVKTDNGCIFGGYTAAAWDSTSGYKADPNAFIFSLVNLRSTPLLIPVKFGVQYSIYCQATYGPTFGGGHDLYIANNSNSTTASYSNLGKRYAFALLSYRSTEAKSFLAGSFQFQTSEIEVFQLS